MSARATDEAFDAYVEAQDDGMARIVVNVRPQTKPGLRFGTIRIGTSSPHLPQIVVPVSAVGAKSVD